MKKIYYLFLTESPSYKYRILINFFKDRKQITKIGVFLFCGFVDRCSARFRLRSILIPYIHLWFCFFSWYKFMYICRWQLYLLVAIIYLKLLSKYPRRWFRSNIERNITNLQLTGLKRNWCSLPNNIIFVRVILT